MPAPAYVWVAAEPVPAAVLSPQTHDQLTMEPSGSVDVDASTDRVRSLAEAVNDAVGATFAGGAETVTWPVTVPMAPSSSVTVRVTV